MITHTPRADPTASASPSANRYAPQQLRTPITPNRYRAPSSSSHAASSNASSRRGSVVESADDSPPSKSSTSNWQASIELSLTTRRRLIRKPLPQIPSSHPDTSSSAEDADSAFIDSAALDARYHQAESWWPDALPEKYDPKASTSVSSSSTANQASASSSSSRFSTRPQSKNASKAQSNDGQGLDEQSLRHLLTILHHAALRYESSDTLGADDGTIGRNVVVSANGTFKKQSGSSSAAASTSAEGAADSLYVLDEATLDSLYRALQVAFRHLSQKKVLGALQRTASIRWRAEAQLRNSTAAQAAEASNGLSSRWARFAWPAAALGRAYKEAQKNVNPVIPGDSFSSGIGSATPSHLSHDFYSSLYSDPDHRIRKRDVAVKILSNAVWFVRNYGPVAGVETMQGSDANDDASKDTTSHASDGLPPSSLASIRRTSESLLKKNSGLPNFLSKSSATTALSGTATPESSQSDKPHTPEPASLPSSSSAQDLSNITLSTSRQQLPTAKSETTLDSLAEASLAPSQTSTESTSEADQTATTSTTTTDNIAVEKSKAMEHLASLSAAAGAAMRQRAQQAAADAAANGSKPEDAVDTVANAPRTLHPQSSRPSLRFFISQSEAEAAETDALEKAERDYLAEIGQGCDEWAKMVVCRLCASIQVANQLDKGRRRRSGTLTARDFGQAIAASEEDAAGSSISTRSDMTAKAGKVGHTSNGQIPAKEPAGEPVMWKSDAFEGDELFAHHGTSVHERRASVSPRDEDERVRLVGGSFVCQVETKEQRQALTELLEIALYVGMSMLLEASFLSDSDAARPKIVKVPTRTTSTVDAPQRGTSLAQQPLLSRTTSQQSLDGSQRSVSGQSHSSSHTSQHAASIGEPKADNQEVESTDAKPGSRKWTKGLWGMLGQQSNSSAEPSATSSAGRPGTSDGQETAASRKSLTMHRYHTGDDGNSLSSNRRTIFKAGEEPKLSIASRKAALFANSSSTSAPSTPQAPSSKPHRLVGRLMNAFNRPSATEPSRADASAASLEAAPLIVPPKSLLSGTSSDFGLQKVSSTDTVVSRARVQTLTRAQKPLIQAKPALIFPVKAPSPAALSTSPELSMLLCYQYQNRSDKTTFPTAAYLTAFHRLQALRFLADQRREHVTFAAPSHGISASGDLLPFVGVGVQKPPSSLPWSVISSRPQQQQQSTNARANANSVQLLSYELLSGDGSALGLCRDEVAFYQRLSNSRDVPLGQVIEELSIRACALEADGDAASKFTDSRIVSGKPNVNGGKDRNDTTTQRQAINGAYAMPEQRLQFIHGSCRIRIVATVLPSRLYEVESEAQRKAASDAEKASIDTMAETASAAASPSLMPTKSRESDVSAIAAASHTDKEAANTAFAVAETAVQAAENGTSRPLFDQRGSASTSGIWMWNASAKSGWQGKAMPMSESTYLLSFARYLEAISYHPALRRAAGLEPSNTKAYGGLVNVQQQLRQGRSEDARSVAEGPNLLRFFRSGRSLVKVQVQPLVLYDLHIQGPCLKTGSERRRERKQKQAQAERRRFKQLAEETRLEIQRFFASIKGNTTKLEGVFVSRELDQAGKTIRKKSAPQQADASTTAASLSSTPVSDDLAEPLTLLTNLRTSLRSDEFELYEALQRTFFLDGINDVRKAFADRAKSAKNRLAAWTKKHLTKKEQTDLGGCSYDEPEYLEAGRRAFPGSCYIIRDDEPLSIIAFSLSSRDFRSEMGTLSDRRHEAAGYMGSSNEEHVKQWRSGVMDNGDSGTIRSDISSAASTATTASSLLKDRSMRKVPVSQLDPDKDEVFFDAEPVQVAMKRKKRGRESSILSLTLRRVGSTISESQGVSYRTMQANGRSASAASSTKADDDEDDDDDDDGENDDELDIDLDDKQSSIVNSTTTDGQDTTLNARRLDTTPSRRPSATILEGLTPSPTKPELRTSGSVSALRRTFELRSQSSFSSIPDRKSSRQPSSNQLGGTSTISSTSTDTTFHAQVSPMSGRPASLASIFSSSKPGSEATNSRISSQTHHLEAKKTEMAAPRAIPRSTSKNRPSSSAVENTGTRDTQHLSVSPSHMPRDSNNAHRSAAQPSTTSESTAGADAQSMVSNSTLPGSQAAESPHIKHNLVHGTTKISCVSWFAEEFAALRERWGVEHDFAHSLSRCQPWVATGGKSKSAFFKTADERFIAKQLLTVWSVDEQEAFLEFAPAYIRYMMNSAVNDCPTLLVKIAGVYSIKIKDVKSGETKLKMNVMLLENLWAGDGGKSIRFDLKGIRDRKVKLSAQQQQSLQQAATNAAASGQPLVDVPGAAKGSPAEGSATAAWNAGVQSVTSGDSKGQTEKSAAGDGRSSTQTSPSRGGEASKKPGDATAPASESKPPSNSNAVWWDSEWIERYRHRAFVPETQKEVFYRALQNDTRFLTASNVMDYSLLLGVMERPVRQDDMYPRAAPTAATELGSKDIGNASEAGEEEETTERPSFRCRIVDFLGAFTLAKQLESSSKKALKGQDAKGNVTILPPSEYASRFLSAMDSYFIGTPCQPRLDPGYGFDRMCEETAKSASAEGDAIRRPRLASVL